jgi:hypothetical protein
MVRRSALVHGYRRSSPCPHVQGEAEVMGPILVIPPLAASLLRAPAVRIKPNCQAARMARRTACCLIRRANPEWWPVVEA